MLGAVHKLSLGFTLLSSALAVERPPKAPTSNGSKLITYQEVVDKTLYPEPLSTFNWVTGFEEGDYLDLNPNGDFARINAITRNSTVIVPADKIPANGTLSSYNAGLRTIVVTGEEHIVTYISNPESNYHIIDVASGRVDPVVEDQDNDIQGVTLSNDGKTAAFIRNNNMFLRKADGSIKQITDDGGKDQTNGICLWICLEDPVTSIYFSPDDKYVAFIGTDSSGVKTYPLEYYTQSETGDVEPNPPQYPRELDHLFPKAGTAIPKPRISIASTETGELRHVTLDEWEDVVVGGMLWPTNDHDVFMYEAYNRVQDQTKVVSVNIKDLSKTIVLKREATDGGWMKEAWAFRPGSYVGVIDASNKTYYVDQSDEDGWDHLYLQSLDGKSRIQLTTGEWEVRDILAIDNENQVIYFTAAKTHSTESHIYSVTFDKKITALVEEDEAFWDASFFPSNKHYVANYLGPNVPFQQVHKIGGGKEPVSVIEDNAALITKLQDYKLPNITWFELEHPAGFTMNVRRILPANFNPCKKYPVVFNPYGGPNSQYTSKRNVRYGWQPYIASEPDLNFIVYVVDNRGTGFKGRSFRSVVRGTLGLTEAEDQIWAAKELASKMRYIDQDHMVITGWSFGGYLSAKIVEADADIFTSTIITAPVTDWRLYNQAYTERHMSTPELNPEGYANTTVTNLQGFKNLKGAATFTGGSADDNVNPQNTKILLDNLVASGIPPSKVKMFEFTDNDHSVNYHQASRFHYSLFAEALWEELQRKDDEHDWRKYTAEISAATAASASRPDEFGEKPLGSLMR
jgi:dipeptidyl-peptidase-4